MPSSAIPVSVWREHPDLYARALAAIRARQEIERSLSQIAEAETVERRRRAGHRANVYWSDPVAWASDCLTWPEGVFLTDYQAEILAALVEHRRVAVRGCHGLGKTALASIACLWFADTRDAAGADWKVPTTASVGRQLREYLWPEIRKWARRLRWDVIGREPWRRGKEMLEQHIKLDFGEAFAVVSDDPSGIEGAHATELLYVFDEAKAISDDVFDAAEGAFSTASVGDVGTNAFALAISTPGEPVGRFYAIHARRPGTEAWWVRHVSVDEAIRAGRVSRTWVEQQHLLWGDSAVYANRVLGEFATNSEDAVIPLAWVEAANERWRNQFPDAPRTPSDPRGGTPQMLSPGERLHTVGVDVADGGEDRTVLALRQGNTIVELRRLAFSDDTMVTAHAVMALQRAHGDPKAIVDSIGVGAGVFDRIREEGHPVSGFVASRATKRTDISGEFGFVNLRSWAWWNLREMLDPISGCDVALPPDDRLTGDLTAPKWRLMAGGRIAVESKDDIRKRIGRSTDDGDAVMQAFSESGGTWADLYREAEEPDPDTPKPTQRKALHRGWADVYRTDADQPQPARRGSWFAPSHPS